MGKKKFGDTLMLIIEIITLLIFLFYYEKFQIAASDMDFARYDQYRYIITAITLIMGIGFEWRHVIAIIKGNIKLKPAYLIISVLIIMGLSLPYERVMIWFGIMNLHTVKGTISYLLIMPVLRTIISIMAGVFLVRGISEFDE